MYLLWLLRTCDLNSLILIHSYFICPGHDAAWIHDEITASTTFFLWRLLFCHRILILNGIAAVSGYCRENGAVNEYWSKRGTVMRISDPLIYNTPLYIMDPSVLSKIWSIPPPPGGCIFRKQHVDTNPKLIDDELDIGCRKRSVCYFHCCFWGILIKVYVIFGAVFDWDWQHELWFRTGMHGWLKPTVWLFFLMFIGVGDRGTGATAPSVWKITKRSHNRVEDLP